MVWCYGLVLLGEVIVSFEQIDQMICNVIENVEWFYFCFQLVCWGDVLFEVVMDIVMFEVYGCV